MATSKNPAKRAARNLVAHPKPERGRPTKLNADTQKKICDAILVGATLEASAQYAGISYETFNEWRKQGTADIANEITSIFSDFSEALAVANASAQVYFATNIKQAASNGDWRAASWMLERRFPKDYGLRVGPIDEKEIDDAIESELAKLAAARQATSVDET